MVLEHYLCLNLMEIKNTDWTPLYHRQACSAPWWMASSGLPPPLYHRQACSALWWMDSQSATLRHRSHLCVTCCLEEPARPLPPVAPRRPSQLSSDPSQPQRLSSPRHKRSLKSIHTSAQQNATHFQNDRAPAPS